jgi:hypothetical protein
VLKETYIYDEYIMIYTEPEEATLKKEIFWRSLLYGLSESIFLISHWLFSAFYFVNVQEASCILKGKKPWPKKITSTVVGVVTVVLMLTSCLLYWSQNELQF